MLFFNHLILSAAIATAIVVPSTALAAEVDVYLIAGQSNAINFADDSAVGTTDVGFQLHYARTPKNFLPPIQAIDERFTSQLLNTNRSVTKLATLLHRGGDLAVYAFARVGSPLSIEQGRIDTWYPGDDPAAGIKMDSSMYGNFVTWNNSRLTELISDGHTPVIRGLFWFQGERDAVLKRPQLEHETNFTNLIYRFREDYGSALPIVATRIREIAADTANRVAVNQAMQNVADSDPLVSVVTIENLNWISPTNVHLAASGYAQLASVWADEMTALQNAPSNFQRWADQQGIPAVPNSDSNNNGIEDLVEFSTGLVDLLSLQSDRLITFTVQEEALQDGYHIDLEFSTDLGVWFPSTTASMPIKLLMSTPQPDGDLSLTFEMQAEPPEQLYWRLSIKLLE